MYFQYVLNRHVTKSGSAYVFLFVHVTRNISMTKEIYKSSQLCQVYSYALYYSVFIHSFFIYIP